MPNMPASWPANISEIPRQAGVYLLTHAVTGDTYVGSSRNLRRRIGKHLSSFSTGDIPVRSLREVVALHGSEFSFSVLQITADDSHFAAESAWIDTLSPTLNKNRRAPFVKDRDKKSRSIISVISDETWRAIRHVAVEADMSPYVLTQLMLALAIERASADIKSGELTIPPRRTDKQHPDPKKPRTK